MKFYEWSDIIQGPVDWILNDLDPRSRSLEVKRSKSFFAKNSVQHCHRESAQN